MESIASAVQRLLPTMHSARETDEYEEKKLNTYNNSHGNMTGYECAVCKNRGGIGVITDEGYFAVRNCVCMATRATLKNIERSGLKDLMERYTFDNWQSPKDWQKMIYDRAKSFMEDTGFDSKGRFFFIGGQPGSGKTHICTAMVAEMLNKGLSARYCVWDRESKHIKAVVNDDEEYSRAINPLLKVKVLYIDDFLKVKSGAQPTDADVKLSFEIVNYRYNAGLMTIISTEFSPDELLDIDEAMGSRIIERAGQYALYIGKNRDKNWRLRGVSNG